MKSTNASHLKEIFHRMASAAAHALGSPVTFLTACAGVMIWAALGPACGYSEAWQLMINTGTTIITFLSVFLIQNTQNRDAKAMHLKLDEILHALKAARNELIDLEDMPEEAIERIDAEFKKLRKEKPAPAGRATRKKSAKRS